MVHVRHHVVAQLLLQRGHAVPVEGVAVLLELFDLRLGHREAELLLGRGEADPEVPPRAVPGARREQASHVLARVAFDEGVVEAVAAFHAAIEQDGRPRRHVQ